MSRLALALVSLTLAASPTARAQVSTAPQPGPTVAGWDEFAESVRTMPARMLARLPEAQRNDPQVQQEIARLALEGLAGAALAAIGADGDHPVFLPNIGQVLNVGQPNADTIYRTARITPGGTYRLRGRRGSLPIAKIGEMGVVLGEGGKSSAQVGAMKAYHDINTLKVDAEGRYDVILSPERPAGYAGDWWKLDPGSTQLMVRMVASDWGKDEDPTISIERIDTPASRPRPSAAELEQRLRRLPGAASAMALMFVDHVETLRREGYVNKLKVFDVSQMGALVGQFYYEGAYDLKDDEALIVEAKVPDKCVYRSVILTNAIYETTDWYNNHSSLNDAQAQPDKDGVLRVVVSAKDPGVRNWLDTAGYPVGVIQGRWTDCDAQPIPSVRKVALAEVRRSLPRDTAMVTPAERERIVRERRTALQQRPLW
jgi:hypothetical protein